MEATEHQRMSRCADAIWQLWQEAVRRRDDAARSAFEAAWQRYQNKVEQWRDAYMRAVRGDD